MPRQARWGGLRLVTTDEELVERCQKGDRDAFRTLFRSHRDVVARVVFRMNGPGADSEDLVQEVFLQVHRSLKDFRGQARLSTWLHRIAVNVVLMHKRAARVRPSLTHDEPVEIHDTGGGPLARAEAKQCEDAFRRALDKLPPKKREVYILHELEGLSPGDIAEVVGAPVLTVRTRLFYARQELAELMRAEPSLVQLAAELDNDNNVDVPAVQPEVAT